MKDLLLIAILFTMSCSASKSSAEYFKKNELTYLTGDPFQNVSCVQGEVKEEQGEVLPFANVVLLDGEEFIAGTNADFDGQFKLCVEEEGEFTLLISFVGYSTVTKTIVLNRNKTLRIDVEAIVMKDDVELLKPIIYLYPDDTTTVSVEVNSAGGLTHTYPPFGNGWEVTACPNGTLYDKRGRSYYGLYWEGLGIDNFTLDEGAVVKGTETIAFLESALETLGLTEREANEFIVYWLPVLEKNPYNLIHFSTEEYEEMVPLKINPKPDQVIRVMMVYQPLSYPIEVPLQELKRCQRLRSGFVAVEWGGSENKRLLSSSHPGK